MHRGRFGRAHVWAACAVVIGVLFGSVVPAFGTPGALLWAERYSPANGTENANANAMALSRDGARVFVTGSTSGGSLHDDYATLAYSAVTGAVLWTARYNSPANNEDVAKAIAVSPDGSKVYVTGSSYGGATSEDYATVAYNAGTGALLWVKRYNGQVNGDDIAVAVGVSPNGSKVYVTGTSAGPTSEDYLTVAYNASSGATLWTGRDKGVSSGANNPSAVSVSPDSSKVYVTGTSLGRSHAALTVAYNASTGAVLWTTHYGGTGNPDYAFAMAVSPNGSRVFVTGYGASPTSYDYVTLAYNAGTGALLWTARDAGPGNGFDIPFAIAVSPDSSKVYVTGASPGRTTGDDYLTVAYNASTGAGLWKTRYNGPANSNDAANAIAVSPDGSKVYVTGASTGTTTDSDYATLAYNAATGAGLWVTRYNGPANGIDAAKAIAVTSTKVFVTGSSTGLSNDDFHTPLDNFATLAYSAS